MKDDVERQMNDDDFDLKELNRSLKGELEREVNGADITSFIKRKRIKPNSNKLLPILIGILIIVVFAGGLFYFVTRGTTEGDATIQSKMTDLEQRTSNLERQITELQGKLSTVGPNSALLQQLESLAQKVEALERPSQTTTKSKLKLASPKPVVSGQKKYHTVQKGETLSGISKKYGISVEELRKLNGLSRGQPLRTGQKLLVSVGQ